LNWQNYSIKTPEKIIRWFIYVAYTILTLYVMFLGLFSLEVVIQDAETAVPPITCKGGITAEEANIDYIKKPYLRNGDFNCFCEQIYNDDGKDQMKEFNESLSLVRSTFMLEKNPSCV
jgi:hypothetical protein